MSIPKFTHLRITLFLIAINILTESINKHINVSGVLVIYHKGKNIQTMKIKIQDTINKLGEWVNNTGFRYYR